MQKKKSKRTYVVHAKYTYLYISTYTTSLKLRNELLAYVSTKKYIYSKFIRLCEPYSVTSVVHYVNCEAVYVCEYFLPFLLRDIFEVIFCFFFFSFKDFNFFFSNFIQAILFIFSYLGDICCFFFLLFRFSFDLRTRGASILSIFEQHVLMRFRNCHHQES